MSGVPAKRRRLSTRAAAADDSPRECCGGRIWSVDNPGGDTECAEHPEGGWCCAGVKCMVKAQWHDTPQVGQTCSEHQWKGVCCVPEFVCAVCYDDTVGDALILSCEVCAVRTHATCLAEWSLRAPSCPECRHPFPADLVAFLQAHQRLRPKTMTERLAEHALLRSVLGRYEGATVNDIQNPPTKLLLRAARRGDKDFFEAYRRFGNPTANDLVEIRHGESAFALACTGNHPDLLRYFHDVWGVRTRHARHRKLKDVVYTNTGDLSDVFVVLHDLYGLDKSDLRGYWTVNTNVLKVFHDKYGMRKEDLFAVDFTFGYGTRDTWVMLRDLYGFTRAEVGEYFPAIAQRSAFGREESVIKGLRDVFGLDITDIDLTKMVLLSMDVHALAALRSYGLNLKDVDYLSIFRHAIEKDHGQMLLMLNQVYGLEHDNVRGVLVPSAGISHSTREVLRDVYKLS